MKNTCNFCFPELTTADIAYVSAIAMSFCKARRV